MRLRKDKGVGIKGVLQATQDPNVRFATFVVFKVFFGDVIM